MQVSAQQIPAKPVVLPTVTANHPQIVPIEDVAFVTGGLPGRKSRWGETCELIASALPKLDAHEQVSQAMLIPLDPSDRTPKLAESRARSLASTLRRGAYDEADGNGFTVRVVADRSALAVYRRSPPTAGQRKFRLRRRLARKRKSADIANPEDTTA